MKMIEAIVESVKVAEVREALNGLGTRGMTVSEVGGFERRKGGQAIWAPTAYAVGRPEESKIEVAVDDANVENTVTTILRAAKLVAMGNDDEFTSTIGDAIRIRPLEEREMALRA